MPVPPKAVQEAAARGLRARQEYEGSDTPGTMVGVARARDLSNGVDVSNETIVRMRSFFARHAQNRNTPRGRIAWDLWGGDPGREWVQGLELAKIDHPTLGTVVLDIHDL